MSEDWGWFPCAGVPIPRRPPMLLGGRTPLIPQRPPGPIDGPYAYRALPPQVSPEPAPPAYHSLGPLPQQRDQVAFKAAVEARDKEALDFQASLTKKERLKIRSGTNAERNGMKKADSGVNLILRLQSRNEELTKNLSAPPAKPAVVYQFRAGQSVLQWWASWFAKADQEAEGPPKQLKGSGRPGWYIGTILAPDPGTTSVVYAGIRFSDCPLYHVH